MLLQTTEHVADTPASATIYDTTIDSLRSPSRNAAVMNGQPS
jgi:hypothetical protein